ncbi:7-cyano-7-deazaguanine synthase [Tropicibacter sp. Alg240-R139]|uniref:7-cyano-7-deazaguanine synthase n=1 Tax=Tropicibacter sp. Alg240-R139 TaxID=2305991 RepID=UPI002104F160|nr:7-cyano-7-deazaguanine synthase [Tropicibacter sp. Alg240-R139]
MKVLLLTGGMALIAVAYWKRPEIAITINYGQKAAEAESTDAAQVVKELSLKHEILKIDCTNIGSGDMAGNDPLESAPVREWWPFRNQLLVTFAAARGMSFGATEVMTDSVPLDKSHADGRPEFYRALDLLVALQEGGIKVSAPALGSGPIDFHLLA